MAGSLVLILTAAFVGMTTSPSDYTVAIVDRACAPLEKSSNAIIGVINRAVDLTASPVYFLSGIGTGFLDICQHILKRTMLASLNALDTCLRYIFSILQTVLRFILTFPLKAAKQFTILETVVTKLEFYCSVVYKYCSFIHSLFDHFLYDLLIQTYIKTCIDYLIDACHRLLTFPLLATTYMTDKVVLIVKFVIAIPSRCFIWLVKYILYSLLHPYVCVIYSTCTVGIFVIMIPVLMHVCKITDIRPLIRWMCAVAMNTESRNRVLDILHRMSADNRQAMRSIIDQSDHAFTDVSETREDCAVCYQPECLVRIIPCGHKTTCYKCLREIGKINNRCPMCRKQILLII